MRILREADLAQIRDLRGRGEFFWLDLSDPDRETMAAVGDAMGLHDLAVEDTQDFDQRPKADVYDSSLLLVYFGAVAGEGGAPEPVEVHLHITDCFVLSVHRDDCPLFSEMRERLARRPPENEHVLIYRIIDGLTDSVLDVLEQVAARVDEHQAKVFQRPRARDRDRMAVLRRRMGTFRRVLVIQRQVFDRVVERICQLPGLDEDLTTYYRDVGDHLWRALDEVEAARDSLQGMLETYTNEVQERLTIVATIFLPLTVVTSFFGQNFNWLISHIGSGWAFWGLGIGGVVVACLAIVFWLIHSGLYDRPGSG